MNASSSVGETVCAGLVGRDRPPAPLCEPLRLVAGTAARARVGPSATGARTGRRTMADASRSLAISMIVWATLLASATESASA